MENRSNDLDASDIIRDAFVEEILRRGWNVMPVAESDRLLRENLGVSYGGQLGSTTPEEVCRALKARGVFYGTVEEWNKTTTGIYNQVKVTAGFRLYGESGKGNPGSSSGRGGTRSRRPTFPGAGRTSGRR